MIPKVRKAIVSLDLILTDYSESRDHMGGKSQNLERSLRRGIEFPREAPQAYSQRIGKVSQRSRVRGAPR